MAVGILGNHKIKYIITGTPRSGTGFMAKLFTSAGIPIGHEMFFGMPGYGFFPINAQGDSSWMAVPFMDNFDATIIHIVRNPLDNIASLLHRDTFAEDTLNIYTLFKLARLPILSRYEGLDKYLAFYINWNKEVDKVKNIRVRLEDVIVDPKPFLDKLGIKYDKEKLYRKKYNQSDGFPLKLTLSSFEACDEKLITEFINLAKDYGYDLK